MNYLCPQCQTVSWPPADRAGREYSCPHCGLIAMLPWSMPDISPEPRQVEVAPPELPEVVLPKKSDDEAFEPVKFVRSHKTEAEMDMTPMVDVVFLLLIFFMITAAFGMQKSIEIPDPENDQSSQQAKMPEEHEKTEEDIEIHITREDRIFVEGEEATTSQELYAKLRDHQYQDSQRKTRHLLVVAESEATHETVVRVLDAAAGVGMDSVRLKTE